MDILTKNEIMLIRGSLTTLNVFLSNVFTYNYKYKLLKHVLYL